MNLYYCYCYWYCYCYCWLFSPLPLSPQIQIFINYIVHNLSCHCDVQVLPNVSTLLKVKGYQNSVEKNREKFGNVRQMVETTRMELETVKSQLLSFLWNFNLIVKEKKFLHNYTSINNAKEAFVKQKSKISWVNLKVLELFVSHKVVTSN